jgi:hypothetical protein
MSTYDDASLVLVPSGYKNGVVFSQKPMDANGQLTFTRASDATRVGPNGYIEKVRTNLLTYSQDFSDSSWSIPTTQTKTTGQTDPNGGTTAVLVQNISDGNGYFAKGLTLTANVPHTASIYIKGAASGSVSIRIDDSTAGPQYDINYTTSWQRFSVTRTPNQTGCNFVIGGYGTWDVGTNIYFAFAQAETGDVMTDYIATTSAAVSVGPVSGTPRLDYLNGECPSLLLEPQRTNGYTFSEQFNNAAWNKQSVSVTANVGTSPDGYTNADKVIPSTSSAFQAIYHSSTTLTSFSFSVFAKAAGYNYIILLDQFSGVFSSVAFNLSAGTCTAGGKIENYGNGWYRCSVSATNPSALTAIPTYAMSPDGSNVVFTGDGTSGVLLWGAQFEASAGYSSSYIPTLGTAVTRVADMSGATDYFGAQTFAGDFTFFVDLLPLEGNTGTSDAMILGGGDYNGGGNYQSYFRFASGTILLYGVGEALIISRSYTMNANQQYKILVTRTGTTVKIFANGAQVGASATSSTSVILRSLGWSYIQTNYNYDGGINQVLLMPKGLTDAQAIELTTL